MPDENGVKTLDEEIKDMEEMFDEVGLEVEPGSKDEVSDSEKEEEKTETKETSEEPEESEETKEEKPEDTEEEESEEEESKEEEVDPLKTMEAENVELRKKLDELSTPKKAETEEEEEEEPKSEPVDEIDFVGELDLDNLTRDPVELNKLLNLVHEKGVQNARAESRISNETLLRGIPDIVKTNIALGATLKKASEEFYSENKDLEPFKKTVAAVFEEISAEEPDKPYAEILGKVGTETRKRLDLVKQTAKKDKETLPPNLPKSNKGGKRKQSKPETDSFEDELSAMEAALEED